MNEWTNEGKNKMNDWTYEGRNERTNKQTNECMNSWMHECMNAWVHEWMHEPTHERMNGWINKCMPGGKNERAKSFINIIYIKVAKQVSMTPWWPCNRWLSGPWSLCFSFRRWSLRWGAPICTGKGIWDVALKLLFEMVWSDSFCPPWPFIRYWGQYSKW